MQNCNTMLAWCKKSTESGHSKTAAAKANSSVLALPIVQQVLKMKMYCVLSNFVKYLMIWHLLNDRKTVSYLLYTVLYDYLYPISMTCSCKNTGVIGLQ